jgi:carotenoid cleavage dioxygenase-like enzyme
MAASTDNPCDTMVGPATARGNALNPGLRSFFVPEDEGDETFFDGLRVEGELPTWLRGQLLHPVVGRWHINGERFNGVFDCQAMVQGLSIGAAGHCSYRRRHLDTENLRNHTLKGQVAAREIYSRPELSSALERLTFTVSQPMMSENTWQMLTSFGDGRLMASQFGAHFMEIDASNLATLGPLRYTDSLEEDGAFFYHAETNKDPRTGEVVCSSLRFNMKCLRCELVLYCLDTSEHPEPGAAVRRRQLAVVPWEFPLIPMLHTTWITEHYFVCVTCPHKLDLGRAIWNELGWVASGCFSSEGVSVWDRGSGTTAYVISRESGNMVQTHSLGEDLLAGHIANIFEQAGSEAGDVEIAFDWGANSFMCSETVEDPFGSSLSAETEDELFWRPRDITYRRVIMNLMSGDVTTSAPLCEDPVGHTFTNPKVSMRQHRFSYARSDLVDGRLRLVKLDHVTGDSREWLARPGESLRSETAFIPDPCSDREDAGVLLTWVTDQASMTSRMVVVNAATMKTQASIHLPASRYVPLAFHGTFLQPSEESRLQMPCA